MATPPPRERILASAGGLFHRRGYPFANTAAGIDPVEEPEMAARIDHFKRRQRQFFIDLAAGLVGPEQAARNGTAVFLLYSGAMTEAQNLHAAWPLKDACAVAEQLCGLGGSGHSAG